ncbi:MAG: NAD(P)/FAD-dependent oxidoreductase, partial [Deltaproteobacteria bacterium]|nr:NAD(P)/FAD-dependent oxidoreductase [Deltaproteobacteria bacterium]
MRYVIVGNSAAAVHAAEYIRRQDAAGEILMFSREPYLAYSRPLITEFLFDGVPERRMSYRDAGFYRRMKIDLRLGIEVAAIDAIAKKVRTKAGEEHHYDRLFLGTGGGPFVPPIRGTEKEGVHTLMTWDAARSIKEEIRTHRNAVVLGGGLIGMKAAEGLFEAGVDTTIVELAPQILGRILDKAGAAIYEEYLKSKGMGIITSDTIDKIEGARRVERLKLRSGREIECNLLVVGVGVVPNVDLAKTAGIKVDRGIVVNDRMETSVPGIYAGGDAVESCDVVGGGDRVNAIWPVANAHGKVAGTNMAGGDRKYRGGIPKNSLRVAGLDMISAGMVDAPSDPGFSELTARRDGAPFYRKFIFRGDTLVGAMF